jgi:hypothetical protein
MITVLQASTISIFLMLSITTKGAQDQYVFEGLQAPKAQVHAHCLFQRRCFIPHTSLQERFLTAALDGFGFRITIELYPNTRTASLYALSARCLFAMAFCPQRPEMNIYVQEPECSLPSLMTPISPAATRVTSYGQTRFTLLLAHRVPN